MDGDVAATDRLDAHTASAAVKLSRGATWAVLAIAVMAAMGLSLRNGFVYDDWPAIVHNTRITDPSRWHTIPRAPYWLGTLWRPFTVSLYAVQWYVSGGAAWLFHLVSLLGYFAVGLLLYRLLMRLGAEATAAGAVTVLFLVHPVHVEVVANSVGQAELWVALALLLAAYLYVRAREDGTEGRSLAPLLLVVAIAIMSKEQGFVAPLLLAAAEWIVVARRNDGIAKRVRLLVPVTGLAILLFVIRGILLHDNVGELPAVSLRTLSFSGRLVTFLAVVPEWARLTVWPWHLQADYGPPGIPVGGPLTPRHWLGLLLVLGFVALFLWSRRRAPLIAFGLCWMAITLAPVSNLVTASGIVLAERVLFLPTVGFAMVVVGVWMAVRSGNGDETQCHPEHREGSFRDNAIPRSARDDNGSGRTPGGGRKAHGALALLLTLYAIALTIRSATRVPTWSSQSRFFSDLTIDGAEAYRGWKVSAEYWDSVHDTTRAIRELQQSIALWPHDPEVFEALGQIYRRDGRCDEAAPLFAAGVQADSSATSVRAKLIECLIVLKEWDSAERTADAGVALGQEAFKSMQVRVARLRGGG